MKQFKKMMAMLFVAATMALGACSDKDNETTTPDNIAGTQWVGNVSNSYTMQGITMNFDLKFNMKFTDSEKGQMLTNFAVEVPSMPAANQNQNDTEDFNYTFNGTTLTITVTGAEQTTLTYNESNDTFTMPIPDVDEVTEMGLSLEEILGTNQVVFHKK
ncbi:MAG: hypothetical protein IKN29_01235 [Bacteroidales bacterium]|nr:hypothetical protein [Bacteroidales bacterium]